GTNQPRTGNRASPVAASRTPLVMVFESQSKTISLIIQGQRGTSVFLMPNGGQAVVVIGRWRIAVAPGAGLAIGSCRGPRFSLLFHQAGRTRREPARASRWRGFRRGSDADARAKAAA